MATIGRHAAVAELPWGPRLTGYPAWLSWLFLHLVYLIGARNRISVLLNWSWNYLTWDSGPRLILDPEQLPQSARTQPDAVPNRPPGDNAPDAEAAGPEPGSDSEDLPQHTRGDGTADG
jgi:NADH dehydrogenase